MGSVPVPGAMNVVVSEDACALVLTDEACEWRDVTVNSWMQVCVQALGLTAEDVQGATRLCEWRKASENGCVTGTWGSVMGHALMEVASAKTL